VAAAALAATAAWGGFPPAARDSDPGTPLAAALAGPGARARIAACPPPPPPPPPPTAAGTRQGGAAASESAGGWPQPHSVTQ
jgi:hypothetical protein